jgi:2-iminobutanoate/2-iminopropanoate deaminase
MTLKTMVAMGLLLAATGCATATRAPEFVPAAGAAPSPGATPSPLSPAVRANGFLFLAGQLGRDSTGQLVAGGIQPQTRQTLENIRRLLARTGSSMDRVVKCTVFMADMAEWGAMNEVYATFFTPGHFPARSAVGVAGLALNARVEIECIAAE